MTDDNHLLSDAIREITHLRAENQILRAKVETMDLFACILHTQPALNGDGAKGIDVVDPETLQTLGRFYLNGDGAKGIDVVPYLRKKIEEISRNSVDECSPFAGCRHEEVTRDEHGCHCGYCGNQVSYNPETRNWE